MEVDTSADRPTLKEACHDMHGIGHYVDKYIQKKSAVNLGHGIQTDIAQTRQPAHHQMQSQEDCCQCRKPICEEFYSVDECSLGMFCNAMEPFSMTATT